MPKVVQLYIDIDNVGDRLAPILTERLFGLSVESFDASRHLVSPPAGGILAGLGSFLCNCQDLPLRVWGTGYEYGYIFRRYAQVQGRGSSWHVHAVRGPISRDLLHLPDSVAIGDPALLTPRIHEPSPAPHATVRYFTHYANSERVPVPAPVEICTTRMPPLAAVDLIVASGFVFTESLHVAILAHAYGVPWAWSFNRHRAGVLKWYDWMLSAGLEPRAFHNTQLADARHWARAQARARPLYDRERLLDAFPRDVAS
jgi:hypothetical protein